MHATACACFVSTTNFKPKPTNNWHLSTTEAGSQVESIAIAALPILDRHACVQQSTPANSTSAAISHPPLDASAPPAASTANTLTIYIAKSAPISQQYKCLHELEKLSPRSSIEVRLTALLCHHAHKLLTFTYNLDFQSQTS